MLLHTGPFYFAIHSLTDLQNCFLFSPILWCHIGCTFCLLLHSICSFLGLPLSLFLSLSLPSMSFASSYQCGLFSPRQSTISLPPHCTPPTLNPVILLFLWKNITNQELHKPRMQCVTVTFYHVFIWSKLGQIIYYSYYIWCDDCVRTRGFFFCVRNWVYNTQNCKFILKVCGLI